ncbi:MAG: 50S ribosomal protein L35 [Alphaproteobacteria bacterium]|nr:50S ribosomal protein L35 [Alphaproteobacteria bacterium]NCQ89024.1 50S ribosomal protein L35 [Alphaproteobacteria bacterium]NCT07925.1 50S ribosomal protein L35 [Alphaproteobacteria bacterium]
MPKMKTKSSVKKRFRVTGSGKIKSGQAKTSHMMMNKPKSMKRKARRTTTLCAADAKIILTNWLPYGRKKKKGVKKVKDQGAK